MPRYLATFAAATALFSGLTVPATATPNCLRGHQPFRLANDTVNWAMALAPGANCIQGLRWSTMQIATVSVISQPQNGTIVIVGSGFRYFGRKNGENSRDHFTLTVFGKNRRELGNSTVEIVVMPAIGYMASSMIEQCDGCNTESPLNQPTLAAALSP